jgi:peptidoglycan/xylan/chitin deacetylase (PgdA/CDA1 family)
VIQRFLLSFVFVINFLFSVSPVSFALGDIEPNEIGMIPILEYHKIGEVESRWTRSFDNFRSDLEWLYVNGYRAVSMRDYIDQNFTLAVGFKPVIFTFDDGSNSQIRVNGGVVDPHTAIGIMDQFLNEHPDFGSAAVFYVNRNPFSESDDPRFVLSYLIDTGREIGNHTQSHSNLSLLSPIQIQSELFGLDTYVRELGFENILLDHVAYPFGGVPNSEGLSVLSEFAQLGLLVGADPAYPSYHSDYDAFSVPRIQAIDAEWRRWFRREPGFVGINPKPPVFDPFVSDGKVGVVTVQSSDDLSFINQSELVSGLMPFVDDDLPYQVCGYDDADDFVNYKKRGTAYRLFGLLTRDDWKDDFDSFVGREARYYTTRGNRKGVYLNRAYSGEEREEIMLDNVFRSGVNFVVFDVDKSVILSNPAKMLRLKHFVEKLHKNGIVSVARLVIAQDKEAVQKHPEWSIHHADGRIWVDKKGYNWLDLSDNDVVAYVGDLAERVAELGVDEIQLDYIRFPTEGFIYKAVYDYDFSAPHRWDVIREVVREVRLRLIPRGVYLGVDYLGIVGWNNQYDAAGTGQSISCISPYVDAIYPMAYPSHFGPGFDGHWNPADEPRFFIKRTTELFQNFARGSFTDIRTWLQAFKYRISMPYNSNYMSLQIQGVNDVEADGFVMWNASNHYDLVWPAISSLKRDVNLNEVLQADVLGKDVAHE